MFLFKSRKQTQNYTLDGFDQILYHCGYIFLLKSSAQDINSFSFVLLTKHGQGKRGVLENKNKRATRKIRIAAGRPQCINWLQFLTFLKTEYRPLSGDFIAAYGILLLAILTNGYSCELVYDRTMGGGSCLIWIWLYVDILDVAQFFRSLSCFWRHRSGRWGHICHSTACRDGWPW